MRPLVSGRLVCWNQVITLSPVPHPRSS
jgi:hypothetical protein